MLFVIINEAGKFIAENPALIAMIIVIVEYVKRWTENAPWFKPEYMTALGFLLGFLFAVPEAGLSAIEPITFISQGVALGGIATGLFKVGNTLARTADGK
jgi:hypothetical protein